MLIPSTWMSLPVTQGEERKRGPGVLQEASREGRLDMLALLLDRGGREYIHRPDG